MLLIRELSDFLGSLSIQEGGAATRAGGSLVAGLPVARRSSAKAPWLEPHPGPAALWRSRGGVLPPRFTPTA